MGDISTQHHVPLILQDGGDVARPHLKPSVCVCVCVCVHVCIESYVTFSTFHLLTLCYFIILF